MLSMSRSGATQLGYAAKRAFSTSTQVNGLDDFFICFVEMSVLAVYGQGQEPVGPSVGLMIDT